MSFEGNPNVELARDSDGVVRSFDHLQEPWSPDSAAFSAGEPNAQEVAHQYLLRVADEYRIPKQILTGAPAELSAQTVVAGAPFDLKFVEERKRHHNSKTITYQQTLLELPVWEAKINLLLNENNRVVNSLSSIDPDASAPRTPTSDAKYLKDITNLDDLRLPLGLRKGEGQIEINMQRLLVYLYNRHDRQELPSEHTHPEAQGYHDVPTMILREVPDTIQNGKYYVVREVLFTLPREGYGELNWQAFIEVETGSVLYLRALTAGISRPVTGWVFAKDPVTKLGSSAPTTTGTITELNLLRERLPLPDLVATTPQALIGKYVEIRDVQSPFIPPPASSTGDFDESVETDGFAATNAYCHIATLFKLVEELGFSVETLFNNTEFPVPVDHRALGNDANAQAPGNRLRNGSGGFLFGRSDRNSQIGIAADFRIATHEFGHALLWDAVSSPGFGFAHSAGDALGAIYCDPGTRAPDRFDTFPWSFVRRRHDREVADGWAWDGPKYRDVNDYAHYLREQVLSTTLFRIYRSIGGDAIGDIARQTWASNYTLYLIIGGIASITTRADMPYQYVSAVMLADGGTILGHPGGAVRKIVRWAFEKQGLYHPANPAGRVMTRGPPPPVDVYIDDGRDGEYDYISDFDDAPAVWNRHNPDGGTVNQVPRVGATNYCYVRVKNRGTATADRQIDVMAYSSNVPNPNVWPNHFTAATLSDPTSIPRSIAGNRQQAFIVGPFEWTSDPSFANHSLLASVSARGDLSNIDRGSGLACANEQMDIDKLVPFDNNLALRTT